MTFICELNLIKNVETAYSSLLNVNRHRQVAGVHFSADPKTAFVKFSSFQYSAVSHALDPVWCCALHTQPITVDCVIIS